MEIRAGEIIKVKREEKNYTAAGFAKRIGISPGYLSQLENGRKTNPNLDIVVRISRELDIDIDMLLGIDKMNEFQGIKIPSLIALILAKDRNSKVLEDKEILKKFCSIIEKALDSKYIIESDELYKLFLEDIFIQIDTTLRRYMGIQILKDMG